MSDTRIVKCAKGLLLLIFLAIPLFSSFLPNSSWNNDISTTTEGPLSNPKSAAIPSLGFGRFWVNGTELQENNTLYAHVGDVLSIQIETGSGIPSSIPVTFQQIGGVSNSFSGGSLTKSGSIASGNVIIDSSLDNTEIGMYRISLIAGKGFNFHLNVSHAPPLITNIALWDPLYKPAVESIIDQGTYESYRGTSIYANITYSIRSPSLSSPTIIMRYHNGTGSQMNVSVTTGYQSQPGTFIYQAPVIVTTPNQNNQWLPGDYPLNFTVSYAGALDGFAGINLRILNAPPNITSLSLSPNSLPLPTTSPKSVAVKFAVTDPDDDLVYGSADTPVTMTRDGDLVSMDPGVTNVVSTSTKADMQYDDLHSTNYTFSTGAERSIIFQVLLDTTNLTNVDSGTAYWGLKLMRNGTVDTAWVDIFNNGTQTWQNNMWNFSIGPMNTWLYHQEPISNPLTYMGVNATRSLFLRLRVQYVSDVQISIDLLNVTYNTTLRPGVSGVAFTVYSPYYRSSTWLNDTLSYDVTECYDDVSNQWMFNITFLPGLDPGPYSIRIEVYDHGTAPYRPLSDPIDRDAFANYRGVYSAAHAYLTCNLMLGDSTNNNVTKVVKAPIWGGTPTGMTTNRGSQVGLTVEIDDNAFANTLSESGAGYPFYSNVTDVGKSTQYDFQTMTGSTIFAYTGGALYNNTCYAADGYYLNVSLSNATHVVGLNNFHFKFTLNQYYFIQNEEINSLTLDIRACINSMGMPSGTIDYGMVQVYNLTDGQWYNITSPILGNTKFKKFNDFSDPFSQVINFAQIRQCIDPQSRDIWFRLQYNETSQANADNYGLNITIDYLRLTVSAYNHAKRAIAMLTQDDLNFYWFVMSASGAGTHTVWSVTIPTSALPAGTYELVIRTETLLNGVNYNFTGRFTNVGPYHVTQDWQGLLFKNSTLKVNPAGISVTINPAWVNKTVIRAQPAGFNVQGTYAVNYGSIADYTLFRLQVRQDIYTSNVYFGINELTADDANFNYANGNWWANISFARVTNWPVGVIYFRLWLQADDGAVNVTQWQEMYLIAAPPFVYLEPDFPAVLDIWREVGTSFNPVNVTDYDTPGFLGAGQSAIILEAQNRTGGLHDENVSIWTMQSGTFEGSSTFSLTGTLLVDKDVTNKTFDNFTLVAGDNDPLSPQVSIVRLSSTFHILDNPPKILSVTYDNNTQIYRNFDVNVTIEYQDIDDPNWFNVTVKNYSLTTNVGGILAFQKQNSDFLWTGTSTFRNATIRFGITNATGAYTANLTLVDPDNQEAVSLTTVIVYNNLPVISSLTMTHNGYTFAMQNSPFTMKRGDTLGFTVTLRDEEDSYLGPQRVARVYLCLTHEDPSKTSTYFNSKYIVLKYDGTGGGGMQTWSNASTVVFQKSDTSFGAGTVHVEIMAQDNDGDNNTAYQAGGGLPRLIVNDTTPYFMGGSKSVSVTSTVNDPYVWNVTVVCGDWEGIYQIEVTVLGIKDNGDPVPKVTYAIRQDNWVYNASGSSYTCLVNIRDYVTNYQIKYVNVTRITIQDWDYRVLGTDPATEVYGLSYATQIFTNLQAEVGGGGGGVDVQWVIIIIVSITAAVCAVYAVIYYRKKLSYRRYM